AAATMSWPAGVPQMQCPVPALPVREPVLAAQAACCAPAPAEVPAAPSGWAPGAACAGPVGAATAPDGCEGCALSAGAPAPAAAPATPPPPTLAPVGGFRRLMSSLV